MITLAVGFLVGSVYATLVLVSLDKKNNTKGEIAIVKERSGYTKGEKGLSDGKRPYSIQKNVASEWSSYLHVQIHNFGFKRVPTSSMWPIFQK